MRSLGPETQAALQQGGLEVAIIARGVLRDPVTGAKTVLTIWDGAYDREFETPEYGIELYTGVGAGLVMQPIEQVIGLEVAQSRLTLAGASDELVSQILGLVARAAPIEVWRVTMAGRVLDTPERVFRGVINGLEFVTGAAGEPGVVEATLVPRVVDLIHGPTRRWSHASQVQRGINASVFGAPTFYTSPQTVSLPAGTTAIKVQAVGGGGGGAASDGTAGGAGSRTTAIIKDGGGNAVAALEAYGGEGGSGKASPWVPPPTTPLSPYGDGGAGGAVFGEDASFGLPGMEAMLVDWTGEVTDAWTIEIAIVGAGGAGGGGRHPGSDGGVGAVAISVAQPATDNFMRWAAIEERRVIWGP